MPAVGSGISSSENPPCATFLRRCLCQFLSDVCLFMCALLRLTHLDKTSHARRAVAQSSKEKAITASLHQPEDGCFSFNLYFFSPLALRCCKNNTNTSIDMFHFFFFFFYSCHDQQVLELLLLEIDRHMHRYSRVSHQFIFLHTLYSCGFFMFVPDNVHGKTSEFTVADDLMGTVPLV